MTVVYVKKHHHDLKKLQNINIYPFDTYYSVLLYTCQILRIYIQHTIDNKIMK